MTQSPLNARSELVTPLKRGVGGVLESRRRFQIASAAFCATTRRGWPSITTESVRPGASPTRGSGLGWAADMRPAEGALAAPPCVDAQAASAARPASEAAAATAEVLLLEGRAIGE